MVVHPLLRIGNAKHAHHPGSDLGVFGRRGQPRNRLCLDALGSRADNVEAAAQERRLRLAGAFSSEVGAGSREENASKQKAEGLAREPNTPYFLNQACI